MSATTYDTKSKAYFEGARTDYVSAMPDDRHSSILEIGCAEGGTGVLALSRGKCARYVGIELHRPSAEIARTVLSEVHVGNIETMTLGFRSGEFDVVVISEVLEHLLDPWDVVARLSEYVREGGLVFASSPNVSHYRVIRNLLKGRWELTEHGVMDRTHFRWFTPASYRDMFERAGFVIEEVRPVTPPSWRVKTLNNLTRHRLAHLFMVQISVRGRKIRSAAAL